MSKLFKAVAKEASSLIDGAMKANQDAQSNDPAKQMSATDFDAELKRLQQQSASASPDSEPAATSSTSNEPASTDQGSSPDTKEGEGQSAKDDNGAATTEPAGEETDDPSATAEPPLPEGDLQKATEGISRLVLCLNSIEEAHETGQVSGIAAGIAHNIVDGVIIDLGLDAPAAPALESEANKTENSRYRELKDRITKTLRAAAEKFMEWLRKLMAWIADLRRAYMARKGVYDKTLVGYRARVKALTGQLPTDMAIDPRLTLSDVNLGALSHKGSKDGIEGINQAVTELAAFALNLVNACKVDPATALSSVADVTEGMAVQDMETLAQRIKSYDVAGALRVTPSSTILTASLADYTSESGDNHVTISGIPGNVAYTWNYGKHEEFKDLTEAAVEVSKVSFAVSTDKSDAYKTTDSFSVDLSAVTSLLDLYERLAHAMVALAAGQTFHAKSFNAMATVSKQITAMMEKTATENQHPVSDVQDLVRVFTLISASYERAFVRPVNDIVRVIGRAQEQVLRFAGNSLAAIDTVVKDSKAGK